MSCQNPGIFRDYTVKQGINFVEIDLDAGDEIPDLTQFDGLWVMGGSMNVWEEDKYPWLIEEKQAIHHAVKDLNMPFLGICLGHQLVAEALGGRAEKTDNYEVGLFGIEPTEEGINHPLLKNFRILSIHQKIKILEKLDVDFLITKKFNKQFSKIKSQNFIKEILYKKLKAKYIFVSNNFRFGNKREGDVNELIRNEKNYNYKIIKPKPFKLKNTVISSTLIRKLLSNGKIEFVNRLLSRNWSIESKVEKGRQLGKKIGFPTCNLNIKNYVIAKTGVYAVKIYQKNKNFSLKGIAS